MPHLLSYQREEGSRMPVHDRLGPCQSGPARQAQPVRPIPYDRSNLSLQRPAQFVPPWMEYHVNEKKQEVQPTVDSEKPKADAIV